MKCLKMIFVLKEIKCHFSDTEKQMIRLTKSLVKTAEQAILTYVGEDIDIKGILVSKHYLL